MRMDAEDRRVDGGWVYARNREGSLVYRRGIVQRSIRLRRCILHVRAKQRSPSMDGKRRTEQVKAMGLSPC